MRTLRAATPLARIVPVLGVLLAVVFPSADLSGQERIRTRPSMADSLSYRIATFSPSSGPPGTKVSVKWEFLPALTPMRLGVGAQRVGFEVLNEVVTDERGQFADTIRIPEWASTNRPVMLIVFDFYFNPLAISSAFQVTTPEGVLDREGRLQPTTGSCPELLGEGDVRYWLAGNTGAFRPGDRVLVRARLGKPATCGRGERDVVLDVVEIRRAIGG